MNLFFFKVVYILPSLYLDCGISHNTCARAHTHTHLCAKQHTNIYINQVAHILYSNKLPMFCDYWLKCCTNQTGLPYMVVEFVCHTTAQPRQWVVVSVSPGCASELRRQPAEERYTFYSQEVITHSSNHVLTEGRYVFPIYSKKP